MAPSLNTLPRALFFRNETSSMYYNVPVIVNQYTGID
jgi:hypothetical protein